MDVKLPAAQPVETIEGCELSDLTDVFLQRETPLVLKNITGHWPIVIAAKRSPEAALAYLQACDSGQPITRCDGAPETNGRIYYNEVFTGFNFDSTKCPFSDFSADLLRYADQPSPPTLYMASTDARRYFPGLDAQHNLGIDRLNPINLIWVGNRTQIAAHFDSPTNVACCLAGRRRFTLFPPSQAANLYPGPMEFAPGGQEISLIDFTRPDLAKFPKFLQAMQHAQVAELEPGDALILPGMWWHQVEGLDAVNVLYTHWWRTSPSYLGRPANALLSALLSLRNLPKTEREAWKYLFDYYVFEASSEDIQHIPEAARGMLNMPLSELDARKLRAEIIKRLNI